MPRNFRPVGPLGGAYLQWLFHTDFRYLPPQRQRIVVLLARFKEPIAQGMRRKLDSHGIRISSWYEGYRHATVSVTLQAKEPRAEVRFRFLKILGDAGADCIELASPTGVDFCPAWPIQPLAEGPDTVLGIIDDGCPFGHQHYRPVNPADLAVRFIWNQGTDCAIAKTGMPVPYGAALLEQDLQALLASATTAASIVEEDTLYELSGLPSLRSATSHGAQVMSHASGKARHRREPFAVPGRSDIAFVQLPSAALDEPSGNWMHHYALDGIHAIRSYAREMFQRPAARVIVNLSYGPQTGPHDGSSIFETAADEIVEQAAADGYDLQVVVPSGNSHRSRVHAEFDLSRGGGRIDWCVAPDAQVPSYLEVWLPAGAAMADLEASLTSPAGEKITTTSLDGTATVRAGPVCGNKGRTLVLMAIGPTARPREQALPSQPLAIPGRWRVEVKVRPGHSVTVPMPVAHAYLARIDPNLGRTSRGHSGYLDSPGYDPMRYLRESPQQCGNAPLPAAAVSAQGSFSGIATAAKVMVAAGYVASTKVPAAYSSGGPGRADRKGPDWAFPTDDSVVRPGLLAGGNRSASVMRLVGTSFAAPQLARQLLEPPLAPATLAALPSLSAACFEERFGKGLR